MSTLVASTSIRSSVCDDVIVKIADRRSERRGALELVYQSYRRAGLCRDCPSGLRWTPYQLLPTTDIIVAKLRGEVISTLSLVRDGELGLPMEEIYANEVDSRRALGFRLAEVSCLADRRRDAERFFGLFCDMSRLMAQLAKSLGVDELLAAVHPRHAPLYRRYMAFTHMGDRRDYQTVCGSPAVALNSNFARAAAESPESWGRFFGEPLPHAAIQSHPMPESDRDYFLSLCPENCSCRASGSEMFHDPLATRTTSVTLESCA
jgi:hypothetical protein